jgi:hypothetical protein
VGGVCRDATKSKPPEVLAIVHEEDSAPPKFVLSRLSSGKALSPVSILSPYEFGLGGQPFPNLRRDLRWYLEEFLDYPFHPETVRADQVLETLKAWGNQAFGALFVRRDGGEWVAS